MADIRFIGDKKIDFNKILIPRTHKTIGQFISEIEPNFERIASRNRLLGKKPFDSKYSLKQWLIGNQDGYPKFNFEIYHYFYSKCK